MLTNSPFTNNFKEDNVAWEGGKAYCEASAKAGEEWDKIENKRTQADNQYACKKIDKLSTSDAGFSSPQDAMI